MRNSCRLAIVCAFLCALGRLQAADPSRPNIVLLLADNWAWPHAGAYGDRVVKTATFDRLAREGVLFESAFCSVPSCSPARAVLLTGRPMHCLGQSANLWSRFGRGLVTYTDLLEQGGYLVGLVGKGWGPGSLEHSGRIRNPAGEEFGSVAEFLDKASPGRPFCLWFGSHDPHLPWTRGDRHDEALDPAAIEVPPHLPDHPVVREDILGYYAEVRQFDQECGRIIAELRQRGLLDNTLLMMAGDNGWQIPRGLANVYDSGTHVPLVVRWPQLAQPARRAGEFVSFEDLAPTILEAAGLQPPAAMVGRSLLHLLRGGNEPHRDAVFLERERHANARAGDLGYPCRAIRTQTFLYIRNLRPDRWPAGDPVLHFAVGPYGDIDSSPTKDLLMRRPLPPDWGPCWRLCFEKRPAEELYDLSQDPHQLENVAGRPEYAARQRQLRARLEKWMADTGDPRVDPACDDFDRYPYYGRPARSRPASNSPRKGPPPTQ